MIVSFVRIVTKRLMKTSLFDYVLSKDLIAQNPPQKRGSTRLLVLDRSSGKIKHRFYSNIPDYVRDGDVVVLNRTKVMKARLRAKVVRTGKSVEVLMLERMSDSHGEEVWHCLIGGAKRVRIEDELQIGSDNIVILQRDERERGFVVQIHDAMSVMSRHGHVPLPPYIKRKDTKNDEVRYNTIFAQNLESVATPTASLNLTETLLREIENKGAVIVYVDLVVGLGTFASVDTEHVEDFKIHHEHITVSSAAAQKINEGTGRVWAFGTTVVRTLESVAVSKGKVTAFEGETDLFIYPGFEFNIADVLVTNFHMPGTSLVMLVSAFAGREHVLHAYEDAIHEKYAFLSYGDSMLIGDFEKALGMVNGTCTREKSGTRA